MTAAMLADYDVVISNWNNWGDKAAVKDWPAEAKAALIAFVRGGGGYVTIHAGASSFYDWPEYQQIGIASWDLEKTSHGPRHAFTVRRTDTGHPITADLQPFKTFDELWNSPSVQPGAKALLEAYSDPEAKGSGKWEPVLFVDDFGKGRCTALLLGHDKQAMENPYFAALTARCAEWAATGKVTAPLPVVAAEDNLKEHSK